MDYDSIAKKCDNVKGVSWKIVEKFADSNKKLKIYDMRRCYEDVLKLKISIRNNKQ